MHTKLSDSEKVFFPKIPPNGANFEWSVICVTLIPNFWSCHAWIVEVLFFLTMHTFFILLSFFLVLLSRRSEKWEIRKKRVRNRNVVSGYAGK